jgi:hypothetical protein
MLPRLPRRTQLEAAVGFQRSDDTRAIERYRYMLSTAPPEDIEKAHEEAFSRLTPDQRRTILRELSDQVPAAEIQGDDPRSLARTATRAEMRQPGALERTWSGPGLGGMFLSTLAGAFIGTAIAQQFFVDDAAAAEADSGTEGDAGAGGDDGDTGDGSPDGDADSELADADLGDESGLDEGGFDDGGFDDGGFGGDLGGDLGGF